MRWHEAFLEQAKSDWRTYEAMTRSLADECQQLHYLQMATEKLGKAMLLAEGIEIGKVRSSHKAFTRFLQIVVRHPRVQEELQLSLAQLRSYIIPLLPLAESIERLAPALAQDGPNPEYPWQAPSDTIRVPALFSFPIALQLQSPIGRKFLRLVRLLLYRFHILFLPR